MKPRHEVFFKTLEGFRSYLLNVGNFTEAEADIIPKGFKTNIRWNLGHVYIEQYMWIKSLLNEEVDVPKQFDDWFGTGTSPENFILLMMDLILFLLLKYLIY